MVLRTRELSLKVMLLASGVGKTKKLCLYQHDQTQLLTFVPSSFESPEHADNANDMGAATLGLETPLH